MFKKLPIRQCLITSDYRTWKLVNFFDKNESHWLTHIGQQVASKKVLEYANLNAPILSFFLFSKTLRDASRHSNVRFWMCIILDEAFFFAYETHMQKFGTHRNCICNQKAWGYLNFAHLVICIEEIERFQQSDAICSKIMTVGEQPMSGRVMAYTMFTRPW